MSALALKHLEKCFKQPGGNREDSYSGPSFRRNFTPEEDAALRRSASGTVAALFWNDNN
jgi:hypothetical protein